MTQTLVFGVLLALQSAAPAQDAPDRLITHQGVELRSEQHVFLLFAALNALGYAEETRRKGPPLRAPVFHPIRNDVRDQLRKLRKGGALSGIRALFDENSAEIETYLEAVLASRNGGKNKLTAGAKRLMPAVQVLDDFGRDSKLKTIYDQIAVTQREHAKELKKRMEADFARAAKLIGVPAIRAPQRLVVVPNALDGHDVVRRVTLGTDRYLVVGPGYASAQRAVLTACLRPVMERLVAKSYGGAKRYETHWNGLKASKRITRRYANGKKYLAETLARSVAFRVRRKASRDADEDFIDDQAKDAMRWTRPVLKVLDGKKPGESLEKALPALLTKIGP